MIIALRGWKGSGKDTAGKLLVEKYGFRRLAFADVLKDMVAEQYGIVRSHCDDPAFKEKPILSLPSAPKDKFSELIARTLFKELRTADGIQPADITIKDGQSYGMIYSSVQSSDGFSHAEGKLEKLYWTPRALCILEGSVKRSVTSQYWTDRALGSIKAGDDIVITDMRYTNEANKIKAHGETIGNKAVTVSIERFDSSPSDDSSEHDLDNYTFDWRVDNTGTLEAFHVTIGSMINTLSTELKLARNVKWSE